VQNRYAGDVGDFSKFALLCALAGNDLRPGIVWYLNTTEENNRDGTVTNYSRLRQYCPELYDRLATVVISRNRSIAALEAAGVMPSSTLFFGLPVPIPGKHFDEAAAERSRTCWERAAAEAMQGADLVFLDPDNGLAPERVTKSCAKSVKYAFLDEIDHLLHANHSVILYQHHRRTPLKEAVSAQLEIFRRTAPSWALSFHVLSARIYFVLAACKHQRVLRKRSLQFVAGPWGMDGCFCLHDRA
jgi:hypothetical protein